MIFLGWNRPLLHAAADWLLAPENTASTPDLSGYVVVVRGSRAGRRLLELLALRCAERGTILIPPQIVTPSSLVRRLTLDLPDEPQSASPLASALAWAEALGGIGEADRQKLLRRPGQEETQPSLRALLGLGRHLHQLWSDIGGAGLVFRDVIRVLGERFPHVADFEIPRWEVLESLHRRAGRFLVSHGLADHTDLLVRRARVGEIVPGKRVVLVGVAEMPQVVRDFLSRLPDPPVALIFAPETEREGFEEPGILRPGYWGNRSAGLEAGQIHPVERDRDQALRTVQVVKAWQAAGIASAQMTIAVPDTKALPRLREALEAQQCKTRSAQGRPASDAPAFQLLRLVARYLDHAPDEPPTYEAVAALVRHPDLPEISPGEWSALDQFATTHLPARFDPASVGEASGRILWIQEALNRLIDLGADRISPRDVAEWTLQFLDRIYGEREEHAHSPEGRIAVQAFKLLRDVLAETKLGQLPWAAWVRPADFLLIILDFLGEQPVPEPSAPDAIQVVGWLELVEDDTPAVVVTSFYEGAIPESVSSDPFLPGSLRQALSLSDNTMRLARDAYALSAIIGSRSEGRGGLALIAPRFDSADNPVRPSRLLLAGMEAESLARRVWYLAGRRAPEPQLSLNGGPGFSAAVIENHPPMERIRVTAFRDYLESPRKFYFKQVLGLRAEDDAVLELQGASVGTLIHGVLASFGANADLRESADGGAIQAYVAAELKRVVAERFGPWAQPAVEIQVEEVARRLRGFARVQAKLRQEGWTIRHVEEKSRLECEMAADGGLGRVRISGNMDRIDFHPVGQKWRIIDYKTSAKEKEPLQEHRGRNGEWKDLQLPLYLKLAAPYAQAEWGVELTPENCELSYFLLPDDEGAARISKPLPADLIEEGWAKATETISKILRGEFADNPPLNPERNDPALLALCGQVGIASPESAIAAIRGT
jgi:hypothetical protein